MKSAEQTRSRNFFFVSLCGTEVPGISDDDPSLLVSVNHVHTSVFCACSWRVCVCVCFFFLFSHIAYSTVDIYSRCEENLYFSELQRFVLFVETKKIDEQNEKFL